MRNLLIVISTLTIISCSRMEQGVYVPESLPFSTLVKDYRVCSDSLASYTVWYDSTQHRDVLIYCLDNIPLDAQTEGMKAVSYFDGGLGHYKDQCNFPVSCFPGIQRVSLVPFSADVFQSGTPCDIYHLYFKDSIVVAVHRWLPRDTMQTMFTITREDSHYLFPLALWHNDNVWKYVFRKSNRIVGRKQTVDTLCIVNLSTQGVQIKQPVGAKLEPCGVINDSLLWISGVRTDNHLSYNGFDDGHSYLLAINKYGTIVKADTFLKSEDCSMVNVSSTQQLYILPHNGSSVQSEWTELCYINKKTLNTTSTQVVPFKVSMFQKLTHRSGDSVVYFTTDNKSNLLKLDSRFTLLQKISLPFSTGSTKSSLTENEQTSTLNSNCFADVDTDSLDDILFITSNNQLVVISGKTLQPIASSPVFQTPRKYSFIRNSNGTVDILVIYGKDIITMEMLQILPNSTSTKVLAHWDRILLAVVFLLIVPAGAYGYMQRKKVVAERRRSEIYQNAVKLAHGAKTPLETALLTSQALFVILRGYVSGKLSSDIDEQMVTIESSILEASDTISGCLYLARSSNIQDEKIPSTLQREIQFWLSKIGNRYTSRGFMVVNNVHTQSSILVHRRSLNFLLQCAVDNAIQGTPDEPDRKIIVLSATENQKYTTLQIQDNGVGMSDETVQRLFNSPGFTTRELGSGIGMQIIHKSCTQHNATLQIQSKLGAGTTLNIQFPKAE